METDDPILKQPSSALAANQIKNVLEKSRDTKQRDTDEKDPECSWKFRTASLRQSVFLACRALTIFGEEKHASSGNKATQNRLQEAGSGTSGSVQRNWVTPTVVGIILATFFSDVSHEMATAVLPLYLATIGLGPAVLGITEGVADFLFSLSKLAGGVVGHRFVRPIPEVERAVSRYPADAHGRFLRFGSRRHSLYP